MLNQGFPEEVLLLFTVLIWVLYLLVYFSSPHNKVNQWCCICGFLLSIGVLKEYLYFSGIFAGMEITLFDISYCLNEFLNSILTAILYYLSMPCVMVFSFYFCNLDKLRPRLFRLLTILVFLPVVGFGIVYPWSHTRQIPVENPGAYVVVALYNLLYGLLATLPILYTLLKERKSYQFRQRRLVSVIALLPLWYWLITLFLFHLLKLESLYKLWQGNAVILLFLLVYYVNHLFHEGIWGLRLNREYFDWSGETAALPKNVYYMFHMLKGETSKLRWCIQLLRSEELENASGELDIMERSVLRMEEMIQRSSQYSKELVLNMEEVEMEKLLEEMAGEIRESWNGKVEIVIETEMPLLYCDAFHIKEVIRNLTANAIDAMGADGILTMGYRISGKNAALIQISDTGKGLDTKEISHIFEPHYTGYSDSRHFGLGLPYCQKVIKAHRGYIEVKSSTEPGKKGTIFTCCLPAGIRRKKKRGCCRENLKAKQKKGKES